jgi:hypothetical protein
LNFKKKKCCENCLLIRQIIDFNGINPLKIIKEMEMDLLINLIVEIIMEGITLKSWELS